MSALEGVPPASDPPDSLTLHSTLARSIAELAHDGICTVDRHGIARFVNVRLADMLGYPVKALTSRPIADVLAPRAWTALRPHLPGQGTARPIRLALEFRHRSGQPAWTSVAVSRLVAPDLDADGERSLLLVTESLARPDAPAPYRRLAERLTGTLESLTDAFVMLDREWRFTYVNPEAERVLGLAREDAIGRLTRAVLPGAPASFRQLLERAYAGTEPVEFEGLYPPLGRWFEVRAHPVPEGLAIYFRDVTERREAAEALRVSEERFRVVADVTQDVLFDLDLAEGRVWWNHRLQQRFGHAPADLTTTPATSGHIHPDDRGLALECARRALTGGAAEYTTDYRFRRADGTYAHVRERAAILRDHAGRAVRLIGGLEDVSAEHAWQQSLTRQTERLQAIVAAQQALGFSDASRDELLERTVEMALRVTDAEGAVLHVLEGREFVCRAACGTAALGEGLRMPVEGSLAGAALHQGRSLRSDETTQDHRVHAYAAAHGFHSLIASPVRTAAGPLGALVVTSARPACFSDADAHSLELLADSLGAALDRLSTRERLEASEAEYRLLFADNPHSMWVFDVETLCFVAVNRAAVRHYGYSEAEFLRMRISDIRPREDVARLEQEVRGEHPSGWRSGRWRHRRKDGSLLTVEVTSREITFGGRRARLVLAEDVTARLAAEREATRASRALEMLSRCNEALTREEDEGRLLRAVCEIAVGVGGFPMACVAYVQADPSPRVVPQAHAGAEDAFAAIGAACGTGGDGWDGPIGRTIRHGSPVLVPDLSADATCAAFTSVVAAHGFRGMLCLPLRDAERSFGVLVLFLAEVRALPLEELRLLRDLAEDLAFGIVSLRARTDRRRAHEAVLQMARGVSATGDAFFEQLATSLVQALGADAALVSQLRRDGTARTLCAVVDGGVVPNFGFAVGDGPSADLVMRPDVLVVPDGARQRYPSSAPLAQLGAEAYVGTALRAPDGRPIGLMAVAFRAPLDHAEFVSSTLTVFASRAASELLWRESDAALREQASLLDKAQDAIIVCDLEHRVRYWNRGAERLYGWHADEAIGTRKRELLYVDQELFDRAEKALLVAGEWTGELAHRAKDGRHLTVATSWTLVRGADDEPTGVLCINTDVTERRRLEQQFLRTQRLESLGTLAGGIAHDLNNVLTPILMSIDLLRADESDPARLSILTTIEASANRGRDMVRQVLSFARGVDGTRVAVDVAGLVGEVAAIVTETFPREIRVRTAIAADAGHVTGDPTQLHQVLLNLCVNARDAMPQGGVLTLSASTTMVSDAEAAVLGGLAPGAYAVLAVQDSGAGIDPAVIDRIFDPFFTTKEVGKGTGLGLSTSLAIVQGHSGAIRVASRPGDGARFLVYLPSPAGLAVAPAAREREPAPRGHGELVLVVDDEPEVRSLTRRLLEAHGYRVLVAVDGADALALFTSRQGEVALVVTDMMMPGMDGAQLTEAVLQLVPRLPVIGVSGLANDARTARAITAGAAQFLQKPYSADQLLRAVRTALAGR